MPNIISEKILKQDLKNFEPPVFRFSKIMNNYNSESFGSHQSVRVPKAVYRDLVASRNYKSYLKQIRRKKKNELSVE